MNTDPNTDIDAMLDVDPGPVEQEVVGDALQTFRAMLADQAVAAAVKIKVAAPAAEVEQALAAMRATHTDLMAMKEASRILREDGTPESMQPPAAPVRPGLRILVVDIPDPSNTPLVIAWQAGLEYPDPGPIRLAYGDLVSLISQDDRPNIIPVARRVGAGTS